MTGGPLLREKNGLKNPKFQTFTTPILHTFLEFWILYDFVLLYAWISVDKHTVAKQVQKDSKCKSKKHRSAKPRGGSIYIYIYVYVYIYLYIYIYIYLSISIYLSITYTYTWIYTYKN